MDPYLRWHMDDTSTHMFILHITVSTDHGTATTQRCSLSNLITTDVTVASGTQLRRSPSAELLQVSSWAPALPEP